MSDNGYLAGKQHNFAGAGGAVIINGAIGAMLLGLASGAIQIEKDKPIIVTTIPTKPVTVDPEPRTNVDPDTQKQTPTPPRSRPQTSRATNAQPENGMALAGGGDILPPLPPTPPAGPEVIIPQPPQPILPPVRVGASISPKYRAAFQPPYPTDMERGEIEGVVTVRVLIGVDGRVKAVEPVESAHASFLKATREQALRKWRFTPATEDGVAVESWREMTVRFIMPVR
jgi:periplasmic protein TonB